MTDLQLIYSQRDPLWASVLLGYSASATIGGYGCYLTVDAMIAGYYGHSLTPQALNDAYKTRNIFIDDSGNSDPTVQPDELADNALTKVFSDITMPNTYPYPNDPADLDLLCQLTADDSNAVALEIDFDHDPTDGIQTHFVLCKKATKNTDGSYSIDIYDPWYGAEADFSLHYGTNPAQTIQKYVVFHGSPVQMVSLPNPTFLKLVNNSNIADAACDDLSLKRNTDTETNTNPQDVVNGIDTLRNQMKQAQSDSQQKDQTISGLQQTITTQKGQIDTLNIDLNTAEKQHTVDQQTIQQLQTTHGDCTQIQEEYTQLQKDYNADKVTWAKTFQTDQASIAQLRRTSIYNLSMAQIVLHFWLRFFRQEKQGQLPPFNGQDVKVANSVTPPVTYPESQS